MRKYELVEKLLNAVDDLEKNPVEKIEKAEKGSSIEAYKMGRNNGIIEGLLLASKVISSLDIDKED